MYLTNRITLVLYTKSLHILFHLFRISQITRFLFSIVQKNNKHFFFLSIRNIIIHVQQTLHLLILRSVLTLTIFKIKFHVYKQLLTLV